MVTKQDIGVSVLTLALPLIIVSIIEQKRHPYISAAINSTFAGIGFILALRNIETTQQLSSYVHSL